MKILIVGDPTGRDDEGMKRVNHHLKNELINLGNECVINNGFSLKINFSSWDKIVFTGGPTKKTLYKIAIMRLMNQNSEFISCGLMPNIPIKSNNIIKLCINKIVSDNINMQQLADLNKIPFVRQPSSTFSFDLFLRGRERKKPKRHERPLKVLHVGHLNQGRNVFELAKLCKKLNYSITFLVSSTVKEDKKERQRLEMMGAKIMTGYQEDLYEFYRQFDLYAFPVKSINHAISMPLSVIEALLSGLNVFSTDFGEISNHFFNSKCVKIFNDFEDVTVSQLEELAATPIIDISNLIKFDSKKFAQVISVKS